MKDKNLHIIQKTGANVCRFLLAASFIFSGFVKAVDPLGFQYKIQDYLTAFGVISWFPSFFPLLGGIILSAIEFSIGIFLFFGIKKTISTTLALVLMIFMTPLTLYLAIFDPVSDCGCFGEALKLTPPKDMSLEQCLDFIDTDELLEVTPKSLRIRKKILDPTLRKRAMISKKNQ